jgi:hypothetical protein
MYLSLILVVIIIVKTTDTVSAIKVVLEPDPKINKIKIIALNQSFHCLPFSDNK